MFCSLAITRVGRFWSSASGASESWPSSITTSGQSESDAGTSSPFGTGAAFGMPMAADATASLIVSIVASASPSSRRRRSALVSGPATKSVSADSD